MVRLPSFDVDASFGQLFKCVHKLRSLLFELFSRVGGNLSVLVPLEVFVGEVRRRAGRLMQLVLRLLLLLFFFRLEDDYLIVLALTVEKMIGPFLIRVQSSVEVAGGCRHVHKTVR